MGQQGDQSRHLALVGSTSIGQELPVAESFHINEKEVLAVVLAAQRWILYWQNNRVIIR